jgi:peroxiredoxin
MKNSIVWKAAAFFVVLLAGLFFLNMESDNGEAQEKPATTTETKQAPAQQASQEQQAPEAPLFTLKDLEGKDVSLKDYRGKVVFVNFWATWCPPCRGEIPHFVKLIDKYEDKGFAILGISVDKPSDVKKIPDFAKKFKINYPILWDEGNKVAQTYGGITGIPTTFVLDREGRALTKIPGALSYEQFEDIIKQVL